MFARCLERIADCHRHDPGAFVPWFLDGRPAGRVHRERVAALLASPQLFRLTGPGITLVGERGFAGCSAALAMWVQQAWAAGWIRRPTGELYAVMDRPFEPPLAAVDRAAVAWLGVAAAGVHCNGFVQQGRERALWVARRSRGKATFPGHLDNLVAGGMAIGFTPQQTLSKEGGEEAGLSVAQTAAAKAVGSIRYLHQDGLGSKADTLWLFDLELPPEFVPQAVDGEVETFELWPCAAVAASLASDAPWKPNCALVAIDFLLRHGELDALLPAAQRWQLWRALHGG